MLVDGKPITSGFQKGTGFVQQQDNHLPTQTIREAIEFSALLRQPREVSKAQKLDDVNHIIDLLELDDLQDAIIGIPGAGLGVERRKRVTIAVELAAKPDLLLFLDEPTSGLDSAGAASIVRLLRKLADDGQAIICTIHQPSALLFESFDNLLLLGMGGKTAYFGRIGDISGRNSHIVRSYFEQNGAPPCPPTANVAEYILELTAGDRSGKVNWSSRWSSSIQAASARQAIEEIKADRSKRPINGDPRQDREFSASLTTQIVLTTQRLFVDLYRDAAYPYGVLFSNIIVGMVLGLAFQRMCFPPFSIRCLFVKRCTDLGNGVIDFQNRIFTAFIALLNCEFFRHKLLQNHHATSVPAVVNAIIAKFFEVRELFESREGPSKTFSWIAMITSFILTSLPIGVV
jgi:ABC-type multidrug transport system ATPase subunit